MNNKPICIKCLSFVVYCECVGGPRVQRHPPDCQCSMCDIGRGEYDQCGVEEVEEN